MTNIFVICIIKKSYDLNQEIANRSRPDIVDQYAHLFTPDITFNDSTNNTFVVHTDGQSLSEKANALGNAVIVHHDLKDCINDPSIANGDRIFLEEGCYEVDDDIMIEDLSLQIIGIGDSVEIKFNPVSAPFPSAECAVFLCGTSKLHLKNVSFTFPDDYPVGILVSDESMLWMEQCTLQSALNSVDAEEKGAIHMKECKFMAKDIGLVIEGKQEFAIILGCTFEGNESCIETNVQLKCIGNVFRNNSGVAQSTAERGKRANFFEGSVFEGNIFEGYNVEYEWLYQEQLVRLNHSNLV